MFLTVIQKNNLQFELSNNQITATLLQACWAFIMGITLQTSVE